MDPSVAQRALGLAPHEVPQLLVLEGTWWHADALARRRPLLRDARRLAHPDLWLGWSGQVPVAYCPAYGASRAVEPLHLLALCGTPVVVQIGSCGGLQPGVRTGDVVVSEQATIGEGASQYYGGHGASSADPVLVARAADLVAAAGVRAHVGPTVSTSALLAQPDELVQQWSDAGHLGVDMETSAVFSAAAHLGVRAASVLFVWDELPHRSWTDPFSEQETAAQERANALVLEVALGLLDDDLPDATTVRREPRPVLIRELTAGLEGDAVALWQEAGLTRPWNDPHVDLRRAVAGATSAVLAACDEHGRLIGTSMVGHDGHRGWVYYLAVAAEQRRHGVGRALVRACEQWLAERGVPKVNLMVRVGNEDVLAFYRSLGYEDGEVVVLGRFLDRGPGTVER